MAQLSPRKLEYLELGEIGLVEKGELFDELVKKLTVTEASALVARIHERNAVTSKSRRFGLYPVQDWPAFERMKCMEASFWNANLIKFNQDRDDFLQFSAEKRKPLLMAFGFFAVGDGSVVCMLAFQMILAAQTMEQQAFYIVQMNNERVHAETYGKMIYSLVRNQKERDEIFEAVDRVESIKRMNAFIERSFMYSNEQRERYVNLAIAEYVMFIPLFCIIFWYRAYEPGKIKQVIFANEEIGKDEAAHGQNGADNYRSLPKSQRYTDEEIHHHMDEAVKLIECFAEELCEGITLPELTADNVKQYVKFVADDLLDRLGHSALYQVRNPFVWMQFTNFVPKTNFYEGDVGEYSHFNVNEVIGEARALCSDSDLSREVNAYQSVDDLKF